MNRISLAALIVGALMQAAAGGALAQNVNCSDNCGGTNVGSGSAFVPPPPVVPPPPSGGPAGGGSNGAGNGGGGSPLQQAVSRVSAIGAAVLGTSAPAAGGQQQGGQQQGSQPPAGSSATGGATPSLPATDAVRAVFTGAAGPGGNPAATNQVLAALMGLGGTFSWKGGSQPVFVASTSREAGAAVAGVRAVLPYPSPAQRIAAHNLLQRLDGLLKPGQKSSAFFMRLLDATRSFDQFVAVASPDYLDSPPKEFMLIHRALSSMTAAVGGK